MLQVLQAKQKQKEQQQASGTDQAYRARQQPQQGSRATDDAQEMQEDAESATGTVAHKEKYKGEVYEGEFSGRFPDLQPLPSTLRKVKKLLARQEAAADMQALLLLVPCPSALLAQYAARDATAPSKDALQLSRDTRSSMECSTAALPLLQCLMQYYAPAGGYTHHAATNMYTRSLVQSSRVDRYLDTQRLGCFGAIAAGLVPDLLWDICWVWRNTQHVKPMLLQVLLPFAVRHSNAACVQAVLWRFTPDLRCSVLGPQHLAMAAGRTDPWAAGVVRLLLQLLSPQQCKPSHMRPAYRAVCQSGYLPVLQLLLAHAASNAAAHLPVLLREVAYSGNDVLVELLLGDSQAAVTHLQQQLLLRGQQEQQDDEGQAQQGGHDVSVSVQLLRAAWASLPLQQQTSLLHAVLPQQATARPQLTAGIQHEKLLLHMADLLWELLPAAVRLHMQQLSLQQASAPETPRHTDRKMDAQRKALGELQMDSHPARTMWLLQHQLLSTGDQDSVLLDWPGVILAARQEALRMGPGAAAHRALQFHRLLPSPAHSAGAPSLHSSTWCSPTSAVQAALCVLEARVAAACAACDAAAIQQLEQLYMLSFLLLTPPSMRPEGVQRPATTATVAPTLPVSATRGRVVTVAHLSAGLGLPWPLLATLLKSAQYHQLTASNAAGEQRSISSGSIQQQLADAVLAVQDPAAAAAQQGVVVSPNPVLFAAAAGEEVPLQHVAEVALHISATRQYLLGLAGAADPLYLTQFAMCGDRVAFGLLFVHIQRYGAEFQLPLQAAYRHGLQQLTSEAQAEQLGPPPLWQQMLLQVVAQHAPELGVQGGRPLAELFRGDLQEPAGAPVMFRMWGDSWPREVAFYSAGAESLLFCGAQEGRPDQELQQLIAARLLQTSRPLDGPGLPAVGLWGRFILLEALRHRLPGLLTWALQPARLQVLWGAADDAVSQTVQRVAREHSSSPIGCNCVAPANPGRSGAVWERRVYPNQQQQELVEMQQQREQLMRPDGGSSYGPMVAAAGPVPEFARTAVQLALIILQHPGIAADTLSLWLQCCVRVTSPLPDLVRARAIVAAVASSEVVPVGARVLCKEAVRQVLATGDPDLWSLVLLWSHRLPLQLEVADDVGFPLGAGDDDELWEDDLQQPGIAELAAGVDGVNI